MSLSLNDSLLIMNRIARNDQRAIREVIQLYLNKILTLAFRVVYCLEDAEEIAQEVFIKLFQQAPQWKKKASLGTWIYRVTINQALNLKKKKKNTFNLEKINQLKIIPKESSENDLNQEGTKQSLEFFIQQLNEKQKVAITLFYFDNLKLKEAANVMQISEDAYESLLRRGRQKLKTIIKKPKETEKNNLENFPNHNLDMGVSDQFFLKKEAS